MNLKDYEEEVWRRAVYEAESEVMKNVGTPSGGKKPNESVEDYAARCTGHLTNSLARLKHARRKLAEAEGKS